MHISTVIFSYCVNIPLASNAVPNCMWLCLCLVSGDGLQRFHAETLGHENWPGNISTYWLHGSYYWRPLQCKQCVLITCCLI